MDCVKQETLKQPELFLRSGRESDYEALHPECWLSQESHNIIPAKPPTQPQTPETRKVYRINSLKNKNKAIQENC